MSGPLTRYTGAAERVSAQVIGAYSTSFSTATALLGHRHRHHIRNIYALVRVADEIVDGVAEEAGLSRQEQEASLRSYAQQVHLAMNTGFATDLVVHAFARTARACGIGRSLTEPFFASMAADLDAAPRHEVHFDRERHSSYVYGSAEVVGLMCLQVFVRHSDPSPGQRLCLERGARQLGAAFQNINFLRDLGDDTTRLGRHYLCEKGRLDDVARDEWVALVRAQLSEAASVIRLLPRDARAAVRSALALFSALTDRIEAIPAPQLYTRRVRVPDLIKVGLAARAGLTTALERDA